MLQPQNVVIVYAGCWLIVGARNKNVTEAKRSRKNYSYHFWTRFSCSWITLIYLPDTLWFETHGITGGAVFAARTRAVTGVTVVSYRTRVLTSCSDKPVLARAVTIATITWRRLVHNTLATRLAVFAISVNAIIFLQNLCLVSIHALFTAIVCNFALKITFYFICKENQGHASFKCLTKST